MLQVNRGLCVCMLLVLLDCMTGLLSFTRMLKVHRVLPVRYRFIEFYVYVTGLQSFMCMLQIYRVLHVCYRFSMLQVYGILCVCYRFTCMLQV